MIKVITYGTYDLLHYGHIRLLERAKKLGDYLIVGVTADDFDKTRGKINVKQSLMERVEAVRATGLADEIIIEEYEGQKIDDIRRNNVDIFTVGSDWRGKFDYLKDYCEVVYLDRTEGVSSSEIRSQEASIKMGIVGDSTLILKHLRESRLVNGIEITSAFTLSKRIRCDLENQGIQVFDSYAEMLNIVDAIYLCSVPQNHDIQIKQALEKSVHVLVESPITYSAKTTKKLFELARQKSCVLMESIKTAYSTAYDRLLLLVKTGKIGKIVSISSVCTSLREEEPTKEEKQQLWSGFEAWGPTALLPIYQILGTDIINEQCIASFYNNQEHYDKFTKINIVYQDAVASVLVGDGVKSEGELIISGTKGYIYIPAPWWKTDYFEIRYENPAENKRYFYQLDGEGIRYELVAFVQAICREKNYSNIEEGVSVKIADVFEKFSNKRNLIEIEV